ncbi:MULTISPECIES: endolytic transglycosylase MltG [Flavobacterium]|uniref:Endolytic murein transglycosylase n=1 Tax=Flavobacterium hankyongi TaxID=1176532 RepID=A0ABP9A4Z6_9FLAO|nr:endolytic transglycosylase MltG [Flavobacterium sp. N1846]
MNKKRIAIAALVAILAVAIYAYINIFSANTKFDKDEVYVYIPTGSKYEDVLQILEPYVSDISKFKFVAEKRSYDENVFPGRFLFKKGMGSFALVSSLRHNMPLNLAFNNQESLEKLVSRVSSQIEADSVSLMKSITDSVFMEKNGFNKETVLGMFIPNTYELKWNTSADKFRDKMADEFNRFWNDERRTKAKALGMTPAQVITLAAIVHKETVKTDERPRVAGVYLNRLKLEMPLQADPTVIYAVKRESGDFNQVIKRVKGDMLRIHSPYNTYVNIGLPPGPIAMPDITAIDAVLNAEKHDYVYFCASVDRQGYHDFASTYEAHMVNAKKYAEWVTKLGL